MSFIVKFVETGAGEGASRPSWRVRLQHVESGDTHHCETLDCLRRVFSGYGVTLGGAGVLDRLRLLVKGHG